MGELEKDRKDGAPPPRFESTLPLAGQPRPRPEGDQGLDLDLEDIPSRLPYGSEDIADK